MPQASLSRLMKAQLYMRSIKSLLLLPQTPILRIASLEMSLQVTEPNTVRLGSSIYSHEDDEYAQQNEENPLEVVSTSSIQPSPSHVSRENPLDHVPVYNDDLAMEEAPPPYEEPHVDAPQIAPIEYSCENSPQLVVAPVSPFGRSEPVAASVSLPQGSSAVQSQERLATPFDASSVPAPLETHIASSNGNMPRRPVNSPSSSPFSSAKAREAGFDIRPQILQRSGSVASDPSITLISSNGPLKHSRQTGKLTAYLIPFPKPRLKGAKAEEIPDRFLVYTPPLPPLSKPMPGEREPQWHKTRRMWQEDVRKAIVTKASKASWKGMKASSTILIGKGVNLTRSSTVEFLDRAAEGAISSTVEEAEPQITDEQSPITSLDSPVVSQDPAQRQQPSCPERKSSSISIEKADAPKKLEELTLVYPPSLSLAPDEIRTEFVNSIIRTRDRSRKEAVVASSLIPFAAAVDTCTLITFGGLTEISGVWAYTSIRGAMTSKKMAQGLALGQEQALQGMEEQTETRGCTCGHHEHDFGSPEVVSKAKGKNKKTGINLCMQQSSQMETLRRYLDLACLKKDFNMFPQTVEAGGFVDEDAVLEAIGWQPTRRQGRDLELEFKDRVEKLTPDQDEAWQVKEAREDIRRIMKKGASEWVSWCKSFQKDPEAALKK